MNRDLSFELSGNEFFMTNSSLLRLRDSSMNLVDVYRLHLDLQESRESILEVKINSLSDKFCVVEDNYGTLLDEGVLTVYKNGPKKSRSYMYKLSTVKVFKADPANNFLTLILMLLCVLAIFFVTLLIMILKYFNYYKYKQNLKKTTNMIQKEFSSKTEDVNQRKIKPQPYGYTAYKVKDECVEGVKYVPKTTSTSSFAASRPFGHGQAYTSLGATNSFKTERYSYSDNDGGFRPDHEDNVRSPRNSIRVKILI
jgi:hypothetical protein